MASYPQQKLMTDILNLPGFIVKDYRFIDEVGIVLSLENLVMTVKCPHCASSTDKLHQNKPREKNYSRSAQPKSNLISKIIDFGLPPCGILYIDT